MLTRRAGVVGSPIRHSLSPVLHRAAYEALGLTGWTYDAVEVPAGELSTFVAGLEEDWVGLSVTMPGKEEALALAGTASHAARLTGAANTLVRDGDGWSADNTDVGGLAAALVEAGAERPRRATVLGGGATARSALVALQRLGVEEVALLVRDRPRPLTSQLLGRLDLTVQVRRLADQPLVLSTEEHDVVVGTLPATAAAPTVRLGPRDARTRPVVLDVVYAPWPSPLAVAVTALGPEAPTVVPGTAMLLHQAADQVRLMTGQDGPVDAMRDALRRVGVEG